MVMKVDFKKNKRTNSRIFKEGVVRVGFFDDKRYDDGLPVAQVAYWNEYGTNVEHGMPARPFMRPAVFEHKAELNALLRSRYKKAFKDKENTMTVLENFGEYVVDLIQRQIEKTTSPENAPITINGGWLGFKGRRSVYVEGKQGKSHPLLDTMFMHDSVAYKAEEVKKV